MMVRNVNVLVVFVLGSLFINNSYAQENKILYYLSVNQANENNIHNISDLQLNLEYNDTYGTAPNSLFKIYDWNDKAVASFSLEKSAGLNHYSIKLNEIYSGWEEDKVYTCKMKDEGGNNYFLPIRIVPPPANPDPIVNIIVNPVNIGCKDLTQTLVNFYGDIKGGAAPYKVNWYVVNKSRTDFLYQPKEENIKFAGKTSVISVDKDPEYNVVLYVKDACGKEKKQIVSISCGKDKEKINTVFVQELVLPTLNNK